MTITLLAVANYIVFTFLPSSYGLVENSHRWFTLLLFHIILVAVKFLYNLVRCRLILIPITALLNSCMVRGLCFWPRFYYSLFRSDPNRRSIWNIITDTGQENIDFGAPASHCKVRCLDKRLCCYSHYQSNGSYAGLGQQTNYGLVNVLEEASGPLVYNDDPIRLSVVYQFFLEQLPEPPDGVLKLILSLSLIAYVHLYPVLQGLIYLWVNKFCSYLCYRCDENIFINFGKRRMKRRKSLPHLNVIVLATNKGSEEQVFSWDTDGILFIIYNSVTAIICNDR